MTKKKKGAVIGIHGIGKWHAQMQHDTGRIQVVAVCDANEQEREAAAAHDLLKTAKFYTDVKEMLAKEKLDVVSLAVPHHLHAPLAIACLNAGVNVIVEKPMATTYADCVKMIRAAKANKRFLTVFHNRRLDSWYLAAKAAIDEGLLGDLIEINTGIGGFGHSSTWRGYKETSGGVIFDWGAHLTDYSLHFANSEVKAVSGFFYRAAGSDPARNEDHGTARVYFASGAVANITVSAREFLSPYRYRILGTKGMLLDDWKWGNEEKLKVYTRLAAGDNVVMDIAYRKTETQLYYNNIADCLCDGKELMVSAESAAKVINVLCTAERSSAQGGVPLPLE